MICCARCQSERLKPSHSRNLEERVAKWIGRRVYRCINCGWWGILKSDRDSIIRQAMGKAKFKPIQAVIVITVTLMAVAVILYWLLHEPDKQETPVGNWGRLNSSPLSLRHLLKRLPLLPIRRRAQLFIHLTI